MNYYISIGWTHVAIKIIVKISINFPKELTPDWYDFGPLKSAFIKLMSYNLCNQVHRRTNLSTRDLLPVWWHSIQKSISSEAQKQVTKDDITHTLCPRRSTHCLLNSGMVFPFQSSCKTCGTLRLPPQLTKTWRHRAAFKLVLAARTKTLGLRNSPQKYRLYSERLFIILIRWLNSPTPFHRCLR